MAGYTGGQMPEYMRHVHEQAERAKQRNATTVTKIGALPIATFAEGSNHFRIMPSHENVAAIKAAIAGLRSGQNTYPEVNLGSPYWDVFMLKPGFDNDAAKGISLFSDARVVSTSVDPVSGQTLAGVPKGAQDPATAYLNDPLKGRLQYKKRDTCSPHEKAIIQVLGVKERTLLQIVNFGKEGESFHQPGKNQVEVWDVYSDTFHKQYLYGLLYDPFERNRNPQDPFWMGVNFMISRTGKGQYDTEYSPPHAIWSRPYTDNTTYGYPMSMLNGGANIDEIERLVDQIVPWSGLCQIATFDDIQNAMDRVLPELERMFGAGASVAMPGSVGPAGAPPGMSPPPQQMPHAQPAQPPAPQQPYGQPSMPPQPGYSQQAAPPQPGYGQPVPQAAPPAPQPGYGQPVPQAAPPMGAPPASPAPVPQPTAPFGAPAYQHAQAGPQNAPPAVGGGGHAGPPVAPPPR